MKQFLYYTHYNVWETRESAIQGNFQQWRTIVSHSLSLTVFEKGLDWVRQVMYSTRSVCTEYT